jgi:hypothetical protein
LDGFHHHKVVDTADLGDTRVRIVPAAFGFLFMYLKGEKAW